MCIRDSGVLERGIARRAEIVAPRKVVDLGAVLGGDLDRAVRGAGIDQYHLVGQGANRLQTLPEETLFVFGDQADG